MYANISPVPKVIHTPQATYTFQPGDYHAGEGTDLVAAEQKGLLTIVPSTYPVTYPTRNQATIRRMNVSSAALL